MFHSVSDSVMDMEVSTTWAGFGKNALFEVVKKRRGKRAIVIEVLLYLNFILSSKRL